MSHPWSVCVYVCVCAAKVLSVATVAFVASVTTIITRPGFVDSVITIATRVPYG